MTITSTHHRLTRLADLRADVSADFRAELHAHPLTPARRVRHEVRDGVAVIAFSAAASTSVALMLLLVTRVAG
jgi:hypothetical protein